MTAPLQRKNLSYLQDKVLSNQPLIGDPLPNILHLYTGAVMRDLTVEQHLTQKESVLNCCTEPTQHQPSHPQEKMHNIPYIAFAYMISMITLTATATTKEIGESVLFQPVLKTYPTCHSWIITAHVSLGHIKCHWKYFNRQLDKSHQLLLFLTHPSAMSSRLLSPLQVELTTINNMYNSCKTTTISAINSLNTDLSFDGHTHSNTHHRSLLPFLGNALR